MAGAKPRHSSTPATTELIRRGIDFEEHEYTHLAGAESYGLEAAEALGVAAARVFKTLLSMADGRPVVAVVPVDSRLDLKALARTVGAHKAVMAAPEDAERVTGYVVGGISPLGQRRRHTTVVDESAAAHESIFVSGGKRGFDLELSPESLRRVTDALTAPVTR